MNEFLENASFNNNLKKKKTFFMQKVVLNSTLNQSMSFYFFLARHPESGDVTQSRFPSRNLKVLLKCF